MSEPKVFLLPDLGEGLTEAELVNWLVAVGDEIRVDQPIAEVETAKSMVEVPSPYAGTVAVLHGEPGQTLDVGKPLISVMPVGVAVSAGGAATGNAAPGGAGTDDAAPPLRRTAFVLRTMLPAPTAAPTAQCRRLRMRLPRLVPRSHSGAGSSRWPCPVSSPAAVAAEAYREEEKAGSGNVLIGYGTPGGHGVARRTRAPKRAAMAESGSGVSAAEKAADDLVLLRTRVPGKLGAVISPLVRRMARDHGVDLGELQGSGASGLIMRRDVEAVIKPSPVVERPAAAESAARGPRLSRVPAPTRAPVWAFPDARRSGECGRPSRRTCRAAGPRSRKPRCGWTWTPLRSWRCVPR